MANITASIADTGGLQPEVWANRILSVLESNIVMPKLVRRHTDYEPGWLGKQLNIPYPGTFTAQKKAANTATNLSTPSNGNSIAVTLSSFAYVDFLIEDVARVQAQPNYNLLDVYAVPAGIALAEQMETDIMAQIASFTTTAGTYGTDTTFANLLTAKKKLTDNKIPQSPRYAVISTKDEIALISDTSLAQYFAYAKNNDPFGDGRLATLAGFGVFVSQLIPVVAGTPNDTQNIAFHPEAILLSTAPFEDAPAGSGVSTSVITDPDSGISLRMQYQYSIKDRAVYVACDLLYGVTILRNTAGVLLKS